MTAFLMFMTDCAR